MIYLKPELFVALDTPDGVQAALQNAINLEHSTIPPYLYALYSLKAGSNTEIRERISSVVKEEMLHMTLACNVLNALGGTPQIDGSNFVPSYPGPLPGGIENGLKVRLAPFSLDLVLTEFMQIEQPENPLVFPEIALAEMAAAPRTIGQYYAGIKQSIIALGDNAFAKPPRNQITEPFSNLVKVTDVQSAVSAIDLIVEQGEGTPQSPLDDPAHFDPNRFDYTQLAHYYRFAEIVHGKQLIPNPKATPQTPPGQRFQFKGLPIVFAPADVYAAPSNPQRADYPAGSLSRLACDKFNFTYTSMLRSLNAMVNGQPDEFDTAESLMISLRSQAIDMMSGKTTGGIDTGPTFEYQPLDPA
jgi:Ferritin-like